MASSRATLPISNNTPATASARRRRRHRHSSPSYTPFGRPRGGSADIAFPAKGLKPMRQGVSSSAHITLFVADVNGLQSAGAVRADAAPQTTNFAARTLPLLLRRVPTASLRSPPRCATLLARNGLSVKRVVVTNDEKDAAWWAATHATGTSKASPRVCAHVGNGQRVHGLAPERLGRGLGWTTVSASCGDTRRQRAGGRGAPGERSSQICILIAVQ
ncbi:hypothetical protein DFH09DRAFT_1309106 [Mycena vulgaris]|nr:hypothetical protein DFH09DRAFT_1309106 [Mycena vulgaris]